MVTSILSYEDLVDKNNVYLDNLLFGNGFSIHFNIEFRYNNLFDECKGDFTAEDERMFSLLGTQNFETVLRALQTTLNTNEVF